MARRLAYLVPMLLFLGLAGYFAASLHHDPALLPSALLDQPAPSFVLDGLGSKPGLARDDLTGEVVLINFFASWCAPCRVEHPLLMRLGENGGAALYGIAYKDKPDNTEKFLSQLGDPYRRVGLDRAGRVGIDFGVYGVPETYVIDKAGRIRLRHVGPLTGDDIDREILPLLRELARS